ncbi:MAG: hypothetical protein AAF433_03170 [Bacteroidota bacterium]
MRKAVLKSDAPPLTEQDIRRIAIGYLRVYYRYRPRRDFLGTETHDKPHVFRNKITIDARLTFFQEDGQEFIATVEATDLLRRHELDFRFNWAAIFQDALAAGVVLAGLFLVLPQVWGSGYAIDLLQSRGWWQLLQLLLAGMAVYVGLTYRRVAYRYIYAVSQFRRFFANDQWVAFDAALYPEPLDPRFLELERQCVRFGFGMMVIEPDRTVRLLVAPSKMDMFGGRRRSLPPWADRLAGGKMLDRLRGKKEVAEEADSQDQASFLDPLSPNYQSPLQRRQQQRKTPVSAGSGWQKQWRRWWLHQRFRWRQFRRNLVIDSEAPLFYRFRPYAFLGLLIGIGTILGVYWLERYEQAIVMEGEARSVTPIEGLESLDPETAPAPDEGDLEAYLERTAGRSHSDPAFIENDRPLAELADEPEILGGTDLYSYTLSTEADARLRYNCTPLYQLVEGRGFLIIAGRFDQFVAAQARADELHRQSGLEVTLVRTSCLEENGLSNFSIYLNELLPTESEANYLLRSWAREFGWELEILEY